MPVMTPARGVGIHRATCGAPRHGDRRRVSRGGEAHGGEILDLIGLQRDCAGRDDELGNTRVDSIEAELTAHDEGEGQGKQQSLTVRQLVSERHSTPPHERERAASLDPRRFAGGPASVAEDRRSPVALRHRLSAALL